MEASHTIRLRGPWEYRILEPTNSMDVLQGRIDISSFDHLQCACKRIELVRRFNKPTGLEDGDRVEVIIGPSAEVIAIDLNGQELTTRSDELRYDITAQLQTHNILRMVIELDERRNTKLDEVRLEIHNS